MADKKNIVVFASGTKTGGGSGFQKLHEYSVDSYSGAGYVVCKVVSNHESGGVFEKAQKLGVPFEYFSEPWTAERYCEICERCDASFAVLSGWLKFVVGLDPARTINIHPALVSFQHGRFGGPGMFGHKVHEAVACALENGELGDEPRSGFTMHFVVDGGGDPAEGYDKGPVFAEMSVSLRKGMTADDIAHAVNVAEHRWQPLLTDMVVTGKISLEHGRVITPVAYGLLPK